MSLNSWKLRLQSKVQQTRLYRMYSKVRYLVWSTVDHLQSEGFLQVGGRIINFVRYGKGVTDGKNYQSANCVADQDIVFAFESVRPYLREVQTNGSDSCSKESDLPIIDIVIPVYNGLEYLEPLFSSIIAHTDSPYRLIIVDDASPDPLVKAFLRDFVKRLDQSNPKIEVVLSTNDQNRGFVATVNRAMQYVKGHFVLLNTDTEVPPGWLRRLMFPIISDKNIATTTPYTNAGEIFSFPRLAYIDPSQELIKGSTYLEIDTVLKNSFRSGEVFDVPTGMGFCMGVNYDAYKRVSHEIVGKDHRGIFDESAFGRGYGEETDFCQRVISAGFRNVHVPNLFVYHKHGGSFDSIEKKQLIQDHTQIIEKRYPGYNHRVKNFFDADHYKEVREFLYAKIILTKADEVSVIFDNSLGGGACMFADRLAKDITNHGNASIHVRYDYLHKQYTVMLMHKSLQWTFSVDTLDILGELLSHFSISHLHINELVSYPSVQLIHDFIVDQKKRHSTSVTFYVHDYFCLCPNFTLINEKSQYCGIPSLPKELSACERCLLKTHTNYKMFSRDRDIVAWRNMWSVFFKEVDTIVFFSETSKDIFAKAYTNLSKKFVVKPHDTSYVERFLKHRSVSEKVPRRSAHIRIGILGDISYTKGSHVVGAIAQHIQDENLSVEIVLFGESSGLKNYYCVKKIGRYSLSDLSRIVAEHEIDLFLIPSIWPETFSYTTSEVIAMNYPLAVFDLGAPAERVRQYQQGLILKSQEPAAIIAAIKNYTQR